MNDAAIYTHLEEVLLAGEAVDVTALVSFVAALGNKYSHGECRLVHAAMQRRGAA